MREYVRAGSLSRESQFVDDATDRVVGACMETIEVLVCPDCGALVADTNVHDRHHTLSKIGFA
jgi:hypothetical protein